MDVELCIVKENIQQSNMAIINVHIQHCYFQLYIQYSGIAMVGLISYPISQDRSDYSSIILNVPNLFYDPFGTALYRLDYALINKLFPYFALHYEQLALVKSYLVSPPVYISRYIAPPSPEFVGTVQLVNVDEVPVIEMLPEVLLNVPLITPPFPFAMLFQMFVNVHPSILRFPEEEQDINDPPLRLTPMDENEFNVVAPELIYIIFPVTITTDVIYPLVNDNVPPSYLIILPPLFVKLSILESVILTLPNVSYISPLEMVSVS
ncbi:MAG: hypothetical protein EZS28_047274 [Streblomastix strix]|uniref:Uncharacterized protein n=1 Tax=Streblomastix strix TaxID=222440 RepID=A0A5J4TGH5_9EUKA|nr:MAG: hypothetical protein EZS28_047274 [Streblomastix strix]